MNNLMIILIGLGIAAFTGFNDATWAIIAIGIFSGMLDWFTTPWRYSIPAEPAEKAE